MISPELLPMRNTAILAVLVGLAAVELSAQPKLSWEMLSDVSFPKLGDQDLDTLAYYPLYGSETVQMHDRRVVVQGFIIVVDKRKGHYVLSRHPFAACYFCGGGGVESIIDVVFLEEAPELRTDDYVSLEGTFLLNPENLEFGIYLLKDAELAN